MATVSRLSEDALVEVFSHLVNIHDLRGTLLHRTEEGYPHRWIRVTHICREWRLIALNCLSLWTRIIITDKHPERVQASLDRSSNRPIEIDGRAAKLSTLTAWSSTVWRECSCWVRALGVVVTQDVERELTFPLEMPLLEELHIITYNMTDFIPLTNAALPRLKSLESKYGSLASFAGGFDPR